MGIQSYLGNKNFPLQLTFKLMQITATQMFFAHHSVNFISIQ